MLSLRISIHFRTHSMPIFQWNGSKFVAIICTIVITLSFIIPRFYWICSILELLSSDFTESNGLMKEIQFYEIIGAMRNENMNGFPLSHTLRLQYIQHVYGTNQIAFRIKSNDWVKWWKPFKYWKRDARKHNLCCLFVCFFLLHWVELLKCTYLEIKHWFLYKQAIVKYKNSIQFV